MSVKRKVIFEFITRFSGSLYSLLLFAFIGLSFLNSHFNFDLPSGSKIRDVSPITSSLEEAAKLSTPKKTEEIASTFTPGVSSVPKASNFGFMNSVEAQHAALSRNSGMFTITNPTPVSDPSVDAGYGIKRYGSKFLYAHSSLAFGPLKTIYEGGKIAVEMDGSYNVYEVARREVLPKSKLNASSGLRLAIYGAQIYGESYDLALMTCGNGSNDDSNYRLILFLRKV